MTYAIPIGGPYPAAHPEHAIIEAAKRDFLSQCYEKALAVGAVVEIGTMRYDGVAADGRSTLLFAQLCKRDHRRFISIDNSPQAIETASIALRRENLNNVELMLGDGECVLAQLDGKIALLYLDAGDDPRQALAQFQAAEDWLADGAVVVLDDCHSYEAMNIPRTWGQPMPEGKGTLVLPYLRDGILARTPPHTRDGWVQVVRVREAWAMACAIWLSNTIDRPQ